MSVSDIPNVDDRIEAASLDEVLEFCNKVREAGGANPLDALMPAVPEVADQCLVARNLNFECEVDGNGNWEDGTTRWVMRLNHELTAYNIAEAIGTEVIAEPALDNYEVVLPKKIGKVAGEFDKAWQDVADAYGLLESAALYEDNPDAEVEYEEYIEQAEAQFKRSDLWQKYGAYVADECKDNFVVPEDWVEPVPATA